MVVRPRLFLRAAGDACLADVNVKALPDVDIAPDHNAMEAKLVAKLQPFRSRKIEGGLPHRKRRPGVRRVRDTRVTDAFRQQVVNLMRPSPPTAFVSDVDNDAAEDAAAADEQLSFLDKALQQVVEEILVDPAADAAEEEKDENCAVPITEP